MKANYDFRMAMLASNNKMNDELAELLASPARPAFNSEAFSDSVLQADEENWRRWFWG